MASAAPILASTLGSVAVAKIGESQGWNPMLTGVLSAGAGLGVSGLASSGIATRAAAQPGGLLWQSPDAFASFGTNGAPYLSDASISAATNVSPFSTSQGLSTIPSTGEYMAAHMKGNFKEMFSEGGSGQNFLKTMGAQLADAALAEPPTKQPLGGGGGGGGSAGVYQGGGSGGKYQVVGGFPGRAAGPQWKEIA